MTGISKVSASFARDDGPSLADFLPDASSGYTAYAGTSLADGTGSLLAEDAVIGALKTVKDPEIPVNIYDLGLIYDINCQSNGDVAINMSLTAPAVLLPGKCLPRWLRLLPAYRGRADRGDLYGSLLGPGAHERRCKAGS